MATKKLSVMILTSFFIFSGCGYGLYVVQTDKEKNVETQVTATEDSKTGEDEASRYYYTTHSPSPIVLTHADIDKKKVYISRAKETLINFRTMARDTGKRKDEVFIKEVGREANSYVKIYVEPILNDPDAIGNLETKAEIAKLHLLSASLYFELSGYFQSKFYLERLVEQYESDFLSGITIDQMHIGYSTVAEGIKDLQKRIALKQMTTTNNT